MHLRAPWRTAVCGCIFVTWLAPGLPAIGLAAPGGECLPYDFDADRDIDRNDVRLFVACMTGPDLGPPDESCTRMNLDQDNDVDQEDFGLFQGCVGRSAYPVSAIITEFMAVNSDSVTDEQGHHHDWIEIYNPSPETISLKGWFLTDEPDNLRKWEFPDVSLPSGGFKIVFASEEDGTGRPDLHCSFQLENGGEYLALVQPDGQTIATEFAPQYPPQVNDVSYGVVMSAAAGQLIGPGAQCLVKVPVDASDDATWWKGDFPDGGWTPGQTGVGYERSPGDSVNYTSLIKTDVSAQMYRVANRTSFYTRIHFSVEDPTVYTRLTLRMKYDDGFYAWINDIPVAGDPVQDVNWQSRAPNRSDNSAIVYAEFDASEALGALKTGDNVLAIQGINTDTGSSDLVMMPELLATSAGGLVLPLIERYFVATSPRGANGGGVKDLGPIITDLAHAPTEPVDADDLTVTARVTETFNPVGSVTLRYRVMFGNEVALPMLDDGLHGDDAAGDGVFGAVVPASASTPGQMVRYYVIATDSKNNPSRWPVFDDPSDSPEYQGTMVADPSVVTPLPVLYWFAQNPSATNTWNGTRVSLFYNGQLYDNVFCRIRGQSSGGWPKHHYKFDFNKGDHFKFDPAEGRVEEFNLNSTYSDKAYVRQVLAAETYRDADSPYGISFPMRVQQNGQFFSVAVFVEQPDDDYLDRNGLDRDGALYKMYNSCDSTGGAEKKTRRNENNSDLQALVSGLQLAGDARKRYLFDNVDIPGCINYIAATTIMHDNDHVGKNYYVYRDTEGDGEWWILPWDKDLTFGRNFNDGGVLNDTMWANYDVTGRTNVSPSHPLFGDYSHQKWDYAYNRFIHALHDTPEIRAMYLRRLRTVMEDVLQPPGLPAASYKFETRINELVAAMQADVALDRARWGNPGYGSPQDFQTAINILKTQYVAPRRTHLFNTHSTPSNGIIPGPQPANAMIRFGQIEHSPASGVQDEEYIELFNPNAYAVDVTGWKLAGDARVTLNAGTVILPGQTLYVVPSVPAFRARAVSPKGGEMRFVQGNYDGHLVPGEVVQLLNAAGEEVASVTVQP